MSASDPTRIQRYLVDDTRGQHHIVARSQAAADEAIRDRIGYLRVYDRVNETGTGGG